MVGYGYYGGGAVLYDEGGAELTYGTGEGMSGRGRRVLRWVTETLGSLKRWML